jgi:hypothetical protein
MKNKKNHHSISISTSEEVVEKKLKEMNDLLSKVDLSKLPTRRSSAQK